jgi:hypothetical protein
LADIRRAMNDDSILYIEVPFEKIVQQGLPDCETHKRHWHEHINFYSQSSMAALLRSAGYEVLRQYILAVSVAGSDVQILQGACRPA